MAAITLITGGARSGKSAWALQCARQDYQRRLFIATAEATDDEMRRRIEHHRAERGTDFTTIDEPCDILDALLHKSSGFDVAVIDCLTVWLGNQYYRHGDREEHVRDSIDHLCENIARSPLDVVLVTNEVGSGIVPDNALARSFRDMAGTLNRRMAQQAQRVVLCVCGIPWTIKNVT